MIFTSLRSKQRQRNQQVELMLMSAFKVRVSAFGLFAIAYRVSVLSYTTSKTTTP